MKKPAGGAHYDNYQMASGNGTSQANKQVLSQQNLSKPSGQNSNFSNQVKAGISGIGGASSG